MCSISPSRVRGFQARYCEKRLVFAIYPDPLLADSSDALKKQKEEEEGEEAEIKEEGDTENNNKPAGALSPVFLMEALSQLTEQMLQNNEVFADITGPKP